MRRVLSNGRYEIEDLVAARRPGFSLDAPFYISDDVFDLDIAAIFDRHWLFVGAEAELPEPGDYITIRFASRSIFLIRSDDLSVRGFHNVCRHRGAQLLNETSGSVGNIVCPYHQWTYDDSGALIHAETNESFDSICYGLKPVHVRNVAGLLFLCIADNPPEDIDGVRALIEPYLLPHALAETKVAKQLDIVEEGNWKLTMENNRECYHCGGHPELSMTAFTTFGVNEDNVTPGKRADLDRFTRARAEFVGLWSDAGLPWHAIEDLELRTTGFRTERHPLAGAGEAMTMDGRAASKRLLGRFAHPKLGRLHLHLQPNSWHHFQADHAVTFCVLPLSPGQTLLRTTWLVHKDAVEGVDYDLNNLTHVWRQTNAQDQRFVELAQIGAENPAYAPGPYAPSEGQVEKFCNWYIRRLSRHLDL